MVELPVIAKANERTAVQSQAVRPLRVVHLPFYDENGYQPLLEAALKRRGIEVLRGGGGGNFFRSAMFRWQADVLHFHWLHPYLLRRSRLATLLRASRFLAEVALIKQRGIRVVWTVHNLQNHDRHQAGLERWFTRQFARLADRVIVHCAAAGDDAQRLFGVAADRVAVIPHGNFAGCYPNTLSAAEARQRLELGPSDLIYLFLGRIEPYKGVLELVRHFRAFDVPEARLVIAGRPARDDVVPAIEAAIGADRRIRFRPGFVPDSDIQTYMKAADAVVFPYRDVLTSGAVVLAMSFGRTCLAPSRGCIPETLGSDGGYLFTIDDPEGLAKALRWAHAERDRLSAIGTLNQQKTAAWDWDRIAASTERLYTAN